MGVAIESFACSPLDDTILRNESRYEANDDDGSTLFFLVAVDVFDVNILDTWSKTR